jgi:cell division protein FtsW
MKEDPASNYRGARRFRQQPLPYDVKLLFPVLFLVGIGIVMVYSASSTLALKKFGTDYFFLKKQAVFALLGIVALVFCRHFPYRLFRSLTYPLLIIALIFLAVILTTGSGYSAGGATRWFRFGGFTFQPSEFARFAMVIYLAYSMQKKKDKLKDFKVGFLPHVLVLGMFTALIIVQPDFGSVAILCALTWIMLFVGGVRITHLLAASVIILPLAYLLLIDAEYRLNRMMSFWNPWKYSANEGYQIVHSLMAFGTGGIWGVGIGKGYQKLFYLPEPHTDFIFSVIGEELGLLGVLVILGLYALIFWRGIFISRNSQDSFGSFVAMGLTTAIGLQVCINMGVALGLLPTKGLTLPFLSYGGSSLLLNMASIGILMNIGASKKLPKLRQTKGSKVKQMSFAWNKR